MREGTPPPPNSEVDPELQAAMLAAVTALTKSDISDEAKHQLPGFLIYGNMAIAACAMALQWVNRGQEVPQEVSAMMNHVVTQIGPDFYRQ